MKASRLTQDGYSGNADDVGGAAAVGALFLPGIEQHDDEGKQHHDGAGIDDDLGGGQKLGAQQQVEHGQRAHHHDQRERAVDGVALEQEVQCSRHTEAAKNDEQNQIHARAFSQLLIVEHLSFDVVQASGVNPGK